MNSGREETFSNSNPRVPSRGEIWLVRFDPTIGSEIRKTRPAIVVSSDAVGRLPIKLVAPVTDWKDRYAEHIWHVRIDPSPMNGLAKTSAADALQLRCVDHLRFVRKIGEVSPMILRQIVVAVTAIIEYS